MAQTPCIRVSDGFSLDRTFAADAKAGDVVVVGTKPLIVTSAVDFSEQPTGVVASRGLFDIPQKAEVITAGDAVYWDTTGDPHGGTAGSGAATATATANPLGRAAPIQRNGLTATTNTDTYVRVLVENFVVATTVAGSVTADDIAASDATLTIVGLNANQGGLISATGGTSATAGNAGGAVSLVGGTGGATGNGGVASIAGGVAGATSGTGGVASVTGGNTVALAGTNYTGGAANVTGGTGKGTGNGGAATLVGGAAGATGTGGAITVTGGAAAGGIGGAITATGGAGGGANAGGAVAIAGGAGGAAGAGGAVSLTGGVPASGNANGGQASLVSGAGSGTGNGGAVAITSGASGAGATGNGGTLSITGGAAASTNGNGGSIVLTPGALAGTGVTGMIRHVGRVASRVTIHAETDAATLTIAELLTGFITATQANGATQAYTLPTGTLCSAGCACADGDGFEWVLVNLSAAALDTITVTAGDDHTIVGLPIVVSLHNTTGGAATSMGANSSRWYSRKTTGNTWVTYRIG